MSAISAVVSGNNSDLIAEVCRLYLPEGGTVADVTYGKGVFWRKTPESVRVTPSDKVTCPESPHDFCELPYEDDSFDVVVLDPPYIHSPGQHMTDHRYQNAATTKGILHDGIRELYRDGMREAARVSRRQVWVKCKDQVQSSIQRWSHCELLADALALGMFGRDLFILLAKSRTSNGRWKNQYHARKPQSYLWVFEHPTDKNRKAIEKAGVLSTILPGE